MYLSLHPFGLNREVLRFGPNFQFDLLVPPSVPEPDSTLGFLAIGIFGIASTLKGRVKS